MEDILEVYQRPYDEKRPVVCMDETNKQHHKEVRAPLSCNVGQVARFDSEYDRNGTSNIFISFEPLQGARRLKVTRHRKRVDWALFIKEMVDVDYPKAEKVVLVMDNLNTHSGASLYETFEPQEAKRILDKLEIHYTPKHGSWLNIAELELSHLSRQCLARRIENQQTLIKEIAAWEHDRNQQQVKVNWQFTPEKARLKLRKVYPRTALSTGQN